MELFDNVFNKASIYDMLFFNVKSVLLYSTLDELKSENKPMYENWKYISELEFGGVDSFYQDHAINYPEYSRIVAITYATLFIKDGEIKRDFKKIVNDDEKLVIESFMDELRILPTGSTILCGHNIISDDIPRLIKRYLILNKDNENKEIPKILKRTLTLKPWEGTVIDTSNVWKFNGYNIMPIMLIADFLGLKKTVDILPANALSKYYWDNIENDSKQVLEFIGLQSATQTNLTIQLMNELRYY